MVSMPGNAEPAAEPSRVPPRYCVASSVLPACTSPLSRCRRLANFRGASAEARCAHQLYGVQLAGQRLDVGAVADHQHGSQLAPVPRHPSRRHDHHPVTDGGQRGVGSPDRSTSSTRGQPDLVDGFAGGAVNFEQSTGLVVDQRGGAVRTRRQHALADTVQHRFLGAHQRRPSRWSVAESVRATGGPAATRSAFPPPGRWRSSTLRPTGHCATGRAPPRVTLPTDLADDPLRIRCAYQDFRARTDGPRCPSAGSPPRGPTGRTTGRC